MIPTSFSWLFFLIQKNSLIRKVKLNFKIYDVTNWNTNSFIKDCQVSLKVKTIRQWIFFCYWEMHRIYIHRGHPHSTYAQKSPKLDPLPPLCAIARIWLDPPLCVRTVYIFPFPSPPLNKFLFKFKCSPMTISSLFLFLLTSEVKFHSTNIKKISMVSIYSLKPVYTFLYTIINDSVLASFAQKKERFWDLAVQKKIFFTYVRNLETSSSLVRNRTHLAWPLTFPFVRTYYVD